MKYFIKSMIYQMLIFFKRIAYRDDPKTFIFLLKVEKNQVYQYQEP